MTDSNTRIVISKEQAQKLGLKKHYTGKLCNHGHDSPRYVTKTSRIGPCCACVSAKIKHDWKHNKQKCIDKKDKDNEKNPQGKIFWQIRSRARKTGIEFTIEKTDIIIRDKCPCCDKKIFIQGHGVGNCDTNPSIDRVNNDLGYIKGNIEMICFRCNSIKRNATSIELRQIANWMDSRLNQWTSGSFKSP